MITFSGINDESYSGRLGNQIIEILSTIGIAIKNNIPYYFPYWNYSRYFKKQLQILDSKESIHEILKIKECTYVDLELDPKYNYDIANHFFDSNGTEYWQPLQSWKYFNHCIDIVREYFEPSFYVGTSFSDLVSIHVRRGDYVNHGLYANLGKEYYQEAMSYFPKKRFIVFSDDIGFCKVSGWFPEDTLYGLSDYSQIPGNILDWVYMRSCGGHIIANSSYSLSAAYLTGNPTVAPKNWFSGWLKDRCPTDDIYMPSWRVI